MFLLATQEEKSISKEVFPACFDTEFDRVAAEQMFPKDRLHHLNCHCRHPQTWSNA